MSVRGSHRWVRQRTDSHLPSRQPRRMARPRRGTPGRDVSSTSDHYSDKTQSSHYYLSFSEWRRATVEEISVSEHGQRLPAPVGHTPPLAARRAEPAAPWRAHMRGKTRSCCSSSLTLVMSSSLAPTRCAAQQCSHAQARLRKGRCESGAGPAQLPALTCASTGAALSGQ
jgi:hypothetical protein